MPNANYRFRTRYSFERARKYPGSNWMFIITPEEEPSWSMLEFEFSVYKASHDAGASFVYQSGSLFIQTSSSDAVFRSHFENPPFFSELP